MSLTNTLNSVFKKDKLINKIDTFLSADVYKSIDAPRTGWHPSEFCGVCEREAVINTLLCVEREEIEPTLSRIFDVGTALHSWTQNRYLGLMGILWGKWECLRCGSVKWGFMPKECDNCLAKAIEHGETIITYKEVPIHGKLEGCDGALEGRSDGLVILNNEWFVFEFKTINSNGFNFLRTAMKKHVQQGRIYIEAIRRNMIRGLPPGISCPYPKGIIFLYFCKDTSEYKEFLISHDEESSIRELKRPQIIEQALREKALPPRHEDCTQRSKGKAKNCACSKLCFSEFSFNQLEKIGKKTSIFK